MTKKAKKAAWLAATGVRFFDLVDCEIRELRSLAVCVGLSETKIKNLAVLITSHRLSQAVQE